MRKADIELKKILSYSEAQPVVAGGLVSAFGWVSGALLKGVVVDLLQSTSAFARAIGVRACAVHRVFPGLAATKGIDHSPMIMAAMNRAAGEIGDRRLLVDSEATTGDVGSAFWSAWSQVLLGDRDRGLTRLAEFAMDSGLHRLDALTLALQAMETGDGLALLRRLEATSGDRRILLRGMSTLGSPRYIPWFISRMADGETARVAADAFGELTGCDVIENHLEAPRPENFESGPNDDPDDPNVDMDPDDGLPWPDVKKVEAWWHANEHRFQKGTRYFMGQPVTKEHCIQVLKTGYQRQRILAAQYLCLLEPGTPLFNTAAPAWRQQRLLAAM